MEKYWNYEKTITRKQLMKFGWVCSIPIVGWLALLYACIRKPHKENGVWKLKEVEDENDQRME